MEAIVSPCIRKWRKDKILPFNHVLMMEFYPLMAYIHQAGNFMRLFTRSEHFRETTGKDEAI